MENFESYSLLLATIAHRMLGSRGDVEDIVQEAYLRYATAAVPEIGSLKAYLMTIVTHLCLDQRKSARLQHEQPLGLRWSLVPEDIEETALQALEQREAISQALLLLLECLTPDERAVFLLHDVFAYPYEEIARVVGKRPATCRQLAHRAKTRLIERRPRFVPSQQAHHHLLDHFLAASQQGDLQVLLDALVKDMMEQAEQERQGTTTDASSIIPKGLIVLNGVTLTVLECQPDRFSFALIPYAWEYTNLGEIHPGTVLNLETYMVQALQQDGKSRNRESGALYPASNWFLGNEQRYSYPVHSAVSRPIRGSIRREESEDSCVYD